MVQRFFHSLLTGPSAVNGHSHFYHRYRHTGAIVAATPEDPAGSTDPTDSEWVGSRLSNPTSRIHPECYKLALPASPHAAARQEHVRIDMDTIVASFHALPTANRYVIVEGAGGILVPLNDKEFMSDLALALQAKVILVSRDYLGSINHSLLTARACREQGLDVAGWIFNDPKGHYETEIVHWTGLPAIARVPLSGNPDAAFVRSQALEWRRDLLNRL